MKPPRIFPLLLPALALGLVTAAAGAAPKRKPAESDLASKDVRQVSVDLAVSLAKIDTPEPLTASSLPRPFNPPGFNYSAPAASAGPVVSGPVARAFGDREILIALASKVRPNGTFSLGSEALLSFGKKNLRAGDHLTVSYEGQDYNLELVSFDRTNFTLRLNKEEITRPIKPGKNP